MYLSRSLLPIGAFQFIPIPTNTASPVALSDFGYVLFAVYLLFFVLPHMFDVGFTEYGGEIDSFSFCFS